MPQTMRLQDWTTIAVSSNTVIQGTPKYVEVLPFNDVAFYIEISANSGAGLTLETSPTMEEAYFAVFNDNFPLTGTGMQPIQRATVNPLYRYVRWIVSGTGSITFRIWMSLLPPHP
jgi:hypothetical protein